ncbi:MAG: ABC transporter permease [Trebonia sp.]
MRETTAAMNAEFTKLRSVRGTVLALTLFALISIGVAALDGWSAGHAIAAHSPMLRNGFTPEQAGFDGILYGQVAIIVFGVLVVTSEYGSGMIRLSLLAVPRRGRFFLSKMAVAALVIAVVAVPVTVVTYLVTQVALGRYGASISASGVPRALVGSVGYVVLMCLFAAALAAMTRNAIAPLAVLIPLVLAGSHLLTIIGPIKAVARYLPDQAGGQMLAVHVSGGSLSPAAGFAVLLAWVAVALAAGYVLQRLRDA